MEIFAGDKKLAIRKTANRSTKTLSFEGIQTNQKWKWLDLIKELLINPETLSFATETLDSFSQLRYNFANLNSLREKIM